MTSFHLFSLSNLQAPHAILPLNSSTKLPKPHKTPRIITAVYTENGAVKSPEPTKRGRKKKAVTSDPKKSEKDLILQNGSASGYEMEAEDFNDDIDFPYPDPPLLCCFGAAQKEFIPTVREWVCWVHPDIYSEWKCMQWNPPEFVRAPGGPPSNVAIAHARLGGRAAFMGKVGEDDLGEELVLTMNKEKVQTRGVKFDENARTGCSCMRIEFGDDGKMRATTVKQPAEDSFLDSELNLAVLKEARIFHFSAGVLTSPSMRSALFKAIRFSKKFGGLVFFDPNLPLPLWKSCDETWELIKEAWNQADIVEVSREELEFLLDEDHYKKMRTYVPQYYGNGHPHFRQSRNRHHYTREEISPLWHDKMKLLVVTDGTLYVHYYTPNFHGRLNGAEDMATQGYTIDRTGSGDTVVAAIIRKLIAFPEMFDNQDTLERQLRFVICAGIISQWTIGGVRGFPSESAAQNLKEIAHPPSLW